MSEQVKPNPRNPYVGSNVDEFFAADGLLEEIEAAAFERAVEHASLAERSAKHIAQEERVRRLRELPGKALIDPGYEVRKARN